MRVVDRHNIRHEQRPEALDVHLLPKILRSLRLGVVNGFEDLLLCADTEFLKGTPMDGLCHLFKGARRNPVRLLIRRHVVEAVPFQPILVEALVDTGQERNAPVLDPVLLRHDAIDDRRHRPCLFRREEADGLLTRDTLLNYVARRRIPVALLFQRAESGIIAGLLALRQRFVRRRIRQGHTLNLIPRNRHRSLLIRYASIPSRPHAATSSGAKIGGP